MTLAAAPDARSCRTCRHFDNSARGIEAAMPGLATLSSAHAAVRSDDGLCRTRERYLAAASRCADHAARAEHTALTEHTARAGAQLRALP
jgi:hypothetical protein